MKNYSQKILITGSDGQLGHALSSRALPNVIACNRANLDITNPDSIQQAISTHSPNLIINTAAYTAVDAAENDKDRAMLINHQGAKLLAQACDKNQITLLHLSTDYVFDGSQSSAYKEDDLTNPINIYGESKLSGEEAIRKYCEKHLILRISAVFSEHGNNFMKTIMRLACERKELNIVSDQITCPTHADHIANVIYSLTANLHTYGTFHYCDLPSSSWYEFANAIINQARKRSTLTVEKINPIPTENYPTPAKRPAFSVLSCSKLQKVYGIKQANYKEKL